MNALNFNSAQGLHFQFDFSSVGSSNANIADGLSFFIYDGAQSPAATGAYGAGLGYAHQRLGTKNSNYTSFNPTQTGLPYGYLSVIFDEYGNGPTQRTPANASGQGEGRSGYSSSALSNTVFLRGAGGSGSSSYVNWTWGYPLLIAQQTNGTTHIVGTSSSSGGYTASTTTNPGFTLTSGSQTWSSTSSDFRRAHIWLIKGTNSSGVTGMYVTIYIQHGSTVTKVIDQYFYPASGYSYYENGCYFTNNTGSSYTQLKTSLALNTSIPSTMKIGFAASTGAYSAQHAIKNLYIEQPYVAVGKADTGSINLATATSTTVSPLANDLGYYGDNLSNPDVMLSDAAHIDNTAFRFVQGAASTSLLDSTVVTTDETFASAASTSKQVILKSNNVATKVKYTTGDGVWLFDVSSKQLTFTPATPTSSSTGATAVAYYTVKNSYSSAAITNVLNSEYYRSSPTAVTITETKTVNLSGNVYSDPDGGTPTGDAYNGTPLYVAVSNATSLLGSAPVTNGAFNTSIPLPLNAQTFNLYVVTSQPASAVTAAQTPAGWAHTGKSIQNQGSTDIGAVTSGQLPIPVSGSLTNSYSNIKFALHQRPLAPNKSYSLIYQPAVNTGMSMLSDDNNGSSLGQLTATSVYNAASTAMGPVTLNGDNARYAVTIMTLPTNGTLLYNGAAVTLGQVISNYDKTKMQFQFTGSGWTTSTFSYRIADMQGFYSVNSTDLTNELASYTITIPYALPVKIASFTATAINNQGVLAWATSTEINNAGFVIQRSQDAINWDSVGYVATHANGGNSSEMLNYSFTDAFPVNGTNYYRLKQVDLDGTPTYSEVRSLSFATVDKIKLYPNPATSSITLENAPVGASVRLIGVDGKVYRTETISNAVQTLNVSSLISGMYFLQVINGSSVQQTIRFIKK